MAVPYAPIQRLRIEGKRIGFLAPAARRTFIAKIFMKFSTAIDVISDYFNAGVYSASSIRRFSDVHLLWGPIYARAALGIGARNFSLYDLARVPKTTWGNYLVNEPLKVRYAAVTPKEARVVADNKIRFFEHCFRNGVATANIVTLISAAKPEGDIVKQVYSPEALAEVLVPGEYFVKPSSGSHGEGTFSFAVTGDEVRWCGKRGTFAEFFAHCVSALRRTDSLIVQPKLTNHAAIREITHAKGLSTIRVVTARKAGDIKVLGACLRVIVGDSETDSFSHGSSGNLLAAVDIERGELIAARGSTSKTWPRVKDIVNHPTSRRPLVGVTLPCWPEVLQLVRKAHESIPDLHTVGWDVAVLDTGPIVVEANWRYDIDLIQVAYNKGFKSVIDENLMF